MCAAGVTLINMMFWFLLGIVVIGVGLFVAGRLRSRGRLPFVRHHQHAADNEPLKFPVAGEAQPNEHGVGYPGGLDSLS